MSPHPFELRILSVNVARPRLLGLDHGELLISAIDKQPLSSKIVKVERLNLAGDAQSNLEKHGGPDKAVYAYPSEHWRWWEGEQQLPCRPGAFGENLTLEGGDETAVAIGDRFQWGNAVLEITQPRVPCNRLQFHSGRADLGALMTLSGRCGWYFRVLIEGTGPVTDGRLVRITRSEGPSVREAYRAAFERGFDKERRRQIAAIEQLSQAWRNRLAATDR